MVELQRSTVMFRCCASVRHGFQATEVSTGALFARWINGHMPDFGSAAFKAVVNAPIQHQASADADVKNTD